jgi:hypothetical protein
LRKESRCYLSQHAHGLGAEFSKNLWVKGLREEIRGVRFEAEET